jgi:hypothetical protein
MPTLSQKPRTVIARCHERRWRSGSEILGRSIISCIQYGQPPSLRETARVGIGIVRAACALKRHLPRAKLRTDARRGIRRAPTFTASIRPVLTSRRTVLSLTSPNSACVALTESNSGSSEKRPACRSFAGFTYPIDLLIPHLVCVGQNDPKLAAMSTIIFSSKSKLLTSDK